MVTKTPRTGEQAIAVAMADGPFAPDHCLQRVRLAFNVDSKDYTPGNGRDPWAIEAYQWAEHKHPTTDPMAVPRGVPVFWRKQGRPGHVAISLGDGWCLSTDIERPGYFDRVRIADVSRRWGMSLAGWTEDLNGVRVWTEPKPTPAPTATAARNTEIVDELRALAKKYGVSLVYVARLALFGSRSTGKRAAAVGLARRILKPWK